MSEQHGMSEATKAILAKSSEPTPVVVPQATPVTKVDPLLKTPKLPEYQHCILIGFAANAVVPDVIFKSTGEASLTNVVTPRQFKTLIKALDKAYRAHLSELKLTRKETPHGEAAQRSGR